MVLPVIRAPFDRMVGPPAVYESDRRAAGATVWGPLVGESGRAQRLEVPQSPGLVAVVERGPSTYRYDRYLPAEVGRASVLRLRAAFQFESDRRAEGATEQGPPGGRRLTFSARLR